MPLSLDSQVRRRWVTSACMISSMMLAVEATIVAAIMPTIVADLGGFDLFSWVFSAYLLTQAVTTPIYGRIADLYGRKRVFIAGLGLFTAGSVACGFAPSMLLLVLFRALQGGGAGCLMSLAMIVVGDLYEPAERARMQGWLSSVWGLAALAGPFLGAFIVEQFHWALVFWINVPIGLTAIATLAVFHKERRPGAGGHQVDYAGAVLLVVGLGALMIALVQGRSLGPQFSTLLLAVSGIALLALARQERRAAEPILPYRLWRNRIFVVITVAATCTGVALISVSAFLPTYIRAVHGGSAQFAATVIAIHSLAWSLSSYMSAQVMIRTSFRTAGIMGAIFLAVASGILIALAPGVSPLWTIAAAAANGLGMGFCNLTILLLAQVEAGASERGVATSLGLYTRSIGQMLGAALGGAILNAGIARDAPEAADTINQLLQRGANEAAVPADAARLAQAIAASMHEFFLVVGLVAVTTLVLFLKLPARTGPRRRY